MGDSHADAVVQAVERTAATGSAHVSLEAVTDARPPMEGQGSEPPPVPQPGFQGLLNRATNTAFRLVLGRLANFTSAPRRADGFLEFESRRSAIDYGAYAEIVDGPRQWSGRSGRAISTLPEEPAQAMAPLWLFDLLRGVTEASHLGTEMRGRTCTHLLASVDIARVSAARPGPTPLPPGSTFEELGALPVEVWIDEKGLVRRIRFEYTVFGGAQSYSVELFDCGCTTASVDWSRLPVFKDPRTGAPVEPDPSQPRR